MTVRGLAEADLEGWRPLWQAYLRFYRQPLPEATTRRTFDRLTQGEDGLLGLVAVAADGALVGLAHLVFHSSTWATADYCYLEDLWVVPESRGTDVGRQLIEAAYATAHDRGAARVYWHTQQYNGAARSLYDVMGTPTSFVVYEHNL